MISRIVTFASLIALTAILVWACASTRVTSTWKDQNYTGGPIASVMVIGISDQTQHRRIFEDVFVEQFRAVGVEAVASYTVFPEDRELEPSEIKTAARQSGIGSVLVTHLVGTEQKQIYHPPTTSVPYPYYYNYGRYYTTVYGYVHEPGYYTQHEYVKLETNLYDAASEALIWSAGTETVDPDDVETAVNGLGKVLFKRLAGDGLLE